MSRMTGKFGFADALKLCYNVGVGAGRHDTRLSIAKPDSRFLGVHHNSAAGNCVKPHIRWLRDAALVSGVKTP